MTDKYLGDIKKCIATFHLSSKKTPAGKMAAALFNKEDGYSVQEDKLSNSAIVSHKGTTEAQVYCKEQKFYVKYASTSKYATYPEIAFFWEQIGAHVISKYMANPQSLLDKFDMLVEDIETYLPEKKGIERSVDGIQAFLKGFQPNLVHINRMRMFEEERKQRENGHYLFEAIGDILENKESLFPYLISDMEVMVNEYNDGDTPMVLKPEDYEDMQKVCKKAKKVMEEKNMQTELDAQERSALSFIMMKKIMRYHIDKEESPLFYDLDKVARDSLVSNPQHHMLRDVVDEVYRLLSAEERLFLSGNYAAARPEPKSPAKLTCGNKRKYRQY